jgi:outer membrane protein TolC
VKIRWILSGSLLLSLLSLSGCSLTPQPLAIEQRQQLLSSDRERAFNNVEPVGSSLSMSEAIARGIKYNLEYRAKRMEQAIAAGLLNLSRYDMLPSVLGQAGYNYRNNYFITEATGAYSGNPSLNEPFVNSAKDFGVVGLALNWSVLDFGVSYYNAKQNADMVLVAAERRRRSMHLLAQEIQVAYLRAATAQKLEQRIGQAISHAEKALSRSRANRTDGLQNPLETLRYQKSLLDNIKILQTIHRELSTAHIELNVMINAPVDSRYNLDDPENVIVPNTFAHVTEMDFELRALAKNADLGESIYQTRIAVLETRKALLRLFPGLSVNFGPKASNNSFYINKTWVEGTANLSFNFWNLLLAPQAKQNAQANQELAEQKRMMVQMAVLSQVHLAKQQLNSAKEIYSRSTEIDLVDNKILTLTQEKFQQGTVSEAEKVAAESSAILNRLRKYEALSQLYAATSRLQATAGLEPTIGEIEQVPLSELTDLVESYYVSWAKGRLPPLDINDVVENLIKDQRSATGVSLDGKREI